MTEKTMRLTYDELMQRYQIENENLKQFTRARNELITRIAEIDLTLTSLDAIEKTDGNDKALIPLGSGVYIDGVVKSDKNVKYMVGGSFVKDISVKKVVEKLNESKKNLQERLKEILGQRGNTVKNVRTMENLFMQMQQKQQQSK